MCLILFAHQVVADRPLILAANRDEFHDRPTEPLHRWQDGSDILAGRDLRSGGTWIGVTPDGRWAAVTNVRAPQTSPADPPSRGLLLTEYLTGGETPADFAEAVRQSALSYAGFNLLVGDRDQVWWVTNHPGSDPRSMPVEPGVHGLSNHQLDTPWPKVVDGREALEASIRSGNLATESLLSILEDSRVAPDHLLPDTGILLELERIVSARFIRSPSYGTRSSTLLRLDDSGGSIFERRYDREGNAESDTKLEF